MYVPGAPDKVKVAVAPGATSVGPEPKAIPGASRLSVWSAARPFATVSSLWMVRAIVSTWATVSCGPGRLAVAVEQSPGVLGMPKPQIGIDRPGWVVGSGCSVPAFAHSSIGTTACDAAVDAPDSTTASPAVATTTASSAGIFFLVGNARITCLLCLGRFMARRR
jgi:hypothetical protein